LSCAMPSSSRVPITAVQIVWLLFAGVGLVSVGWASAHVTGGDRFVAQLRQSWSAMTIALDLVFLGIPVVVFVVIEARRLGMRAPWAWAPLAIVLPGAFLIPL